MTNNAYRSGLTAAAGTCIGHDFSTQIKWYGNFVTITDQVQFTVQDRVLNEATRVLSLQLGLTIDTLIRNMMVSTASSILCAEGTNGNTPTEITTADIKTAVRALRLGHARLMTKPIPGNLSKDEIWDSKDWAFKAAKALERGEIREDEIPNPEDVRAWQLIHKEKQRMKHGRPRSFMTRLMRNY